MNENQNEEEERSTEHIETVISALIDNLIITPDNNNPSTQPQNQSESEEVQEHQENNTILLSLNDPIINRGRGTREMTEMYEIYRATEQIMESRSDLNTRLHLTDYSPNTTIGVPPSYSTVVRQGRPSLDIRRDVRSMEVHHISPFTTRIPPPPYAESEPPTWSQDISINSSEEVYFGPESIYIWCPRCSTIVVTSIQSQRSKFTHFTAAALCLCGCWLCCLLPYCMNTCKNTYHFCPDCNSLLGVYRPW